MFPRDLGVVRSFEECGGISGRHVVLHEVADVANQPLLPDQPDDRRQEALRYAERHVHARRVAPLADDVAVLDDDAAESAARLDRTDWRIERFTSECRRQIDGQIFGRGILVVARELHRSVELGNVEARLLSRLLLPVETLGIVGGGDCRCRATLRLRPHRRHRAMRQDERQHENYNRRCNKPRGTIISHSEPRRPKTHGAVGIMPWEIGLAGQSAVSSV